MCTGDVRVALSAKICFTINVHRFSDESHTTSAHPSSVNLHDGGPASSTTAAQSLHVAVHCIDRTSRVDEEYTRNHSAVKKKNKERTY